MSKDSISSIKFWEVDYALTMLANILKREIPLEKLAFFKSSNCNPEKDFGSYYYKLIFWNHKDMLLIVKEGEVHFTNILLLPTSKCITCIDKNLAGLIASQIINETKDPYPVSK